MVTLLRMARNWHLCRLAAEYLTFVAAGGKGNVEAVYAAENVWLTQKMMWLLYDVETHKRGLMQQLFLSPEEATDL